MLIDADAATRATQGTRKVRLDFALYIGVFVLSQIPIAASDVLLWADVKPVPWVGEGVAALTLLHGALNAAVYGATLPWMRRSGACDEDRSPREVEMSSLQLASTWVQTGRTRASDAL